jgi:hypothetical protein
MKITHYQFDGDTCRFIYETSNKKEVVSVQNYGGMRDFLIIQKAQSVPKNENIYDYLKEVFVTQE